MTSTGLDFSTTTDLSAFPSIPLKRSRRRNNTRRTERRANHVQTFVGVDGEGINIIHASGAREHRYVMLSCGDDTLWSDGRALTHHDIFPWLYERFEEQPGSVFVGFFLGYDFACWLKTLPEHAARMLWTPAGKLARARTRSSGNFTPFPVNVRLDDGSEWELDMLGMKRLKLRPKETQTWLYVCDTGSFFQTSFLKAIEPKGWPKGQAPCTDEEFAQISTGKGARDVTYAPDDHSYLSDMVEYNRLENRVLARTMSHLNAGFTSVGVRLNRENWYGPGQAIQKWLDGQVGEGRFLAREDVEPVLGSAAKLGRLSYYGGRFEPFIHGFIPGDVHEYDITSAYPHAMRTLPCLCSGEWVEHEGYVPGDQAVAFVYGEFRSAGSIGALPHRTPKGNITYPHLTVGWYVHSEVQAAISAGLIDQFNVSSTWVYETRCEHAPPLYKLAELFSLRQTVGKKTPEGKALKLLINSAYGKFAQSIGLPKYGNPIYASLITAHCRTMILDAIGSHPTPETDLVMIATDGIYFRTPHPMATVSDGPLGSWEHETKSDLVVMKSGVYWTRGSAGVDNLTIKSRGISAKALRGCLAEIEDAFRHVYLSGDTSVMPEIKVPIPFGIISPSLALHRNRWEQCGRVLYDQERVESARIEPKRASAYIDGDVIRSRIPAWKDDMVETTPYDRSFGYLDPALHPAARTDDALLTPFGYGGDILTDMSTFPA